MLSADFYFVDQLSSPPPTDIHSQSMPSNSCLIDLTTPCFKQILDMPIPHELSPRRIPSTTKAKPTPTHAHGRALKSSSPAPPMTLAVTASTSDRCTVL